MKSLVFLLVLAFGLVSLPSRANDLYGVLDCVDETTSIDSVVFKSMGRPEVGVRTSGFRGGPGEMDTFNFGPVRWPNEYIRVRYMYGLTRMPPVTFRSPEQHTWYELPESSGLLNASRVKFFIGAGIEEYQPEPLGPIPLTVAPNPVASRATVRFGLQAESAVRVRLYDRNGREVRTLLDSRVPAGEHTLAWDRRDARGVSVPSGVYLLRFSAENTTRNLKLIVRE